MVPRASRNIDTSARFVQGLHVYGLGNKRDGSPITVDDVIAGMRMAAELGWKLKDGAPLYRSLHLVAQAMRTLCQNPTDFPYAAKAGRWLVPKLEGMVENQPDALTRCIPFPWNTMTDAWDCSFTAVMAQAAVQMETYRVSVLDQLNIHDPPDKRTQVGLNWDSDIVYGFNKAAQALKQAGRIRQIGLAIKSPGFAFEYLGRCPGVVDIIGLTSSPAISFELMELIKEAQKARVQIKLMGILYGGAFAFGRGNDPRQSSGWIYNYEAPSPKEIDRVSRYYEVCERHGVSLLQLAWACAGSLMVAFPDVVTQMVTASINPERLREAHYGVLNSYLPADCIRALKGEGLIHPDFPLE